MENKDKDLEKENQTSEEEKVESKENTEEVKDDSKDKKKKKDKLESLKDENVSLKEEIAKLKNEILKVKADEINFKKRIEEEKDRLVKYSNQSVLEKFIKDLDLFDKVVSMPTEDPVLKNYLIGFEMINNNFKQTLEEEGVKKIIVKVGDKPDPRFHHELQADWNEEYEEGVVLQELQTGYMYKDRVLRQTLVKVNKKEGK